MGYEKWSEDEELSITLISLQGGSDVVALCCHTTEPSLFVATLSPDGKLIATGTATEPLT